VALFVALGNGNGFVKLASLRAPATCWTKTRDCLRAALYIRARSIITPKELNRKNKKDDDHDKRGLAHSLEHVE